MSLSSPWTRARPVPAIVFDRDGVVRGVGQREFHQHYPRPGWVEHDAGELWHSQLDVAREALRNAAATAADVAAIGITNQRETTLIWERATGRAGARHRLAGPPHRAAVRPAARRRARRFPAVPHRPDAGRVLLRHQAVLAARPRARRAPDGRARRTGLRHRRHLAGVAATAARCTAPTPATPRAPCCSTCTRRTGTMTSWRC